MTWFSVSVSYRSRPDVPTRSPDFYRLAFSSNFRILVILFGCVLVRLFNGSRSRGAGTHPATDLSFVLERPPFLRTRT